MLSLFTNVALLREPRPKTSLTDQGVFTTILSRHDADVAQLVEQLIRNQ